MTLRTLHKWLSIVIGLQIVIWVTSGMIISLLDHSLVAGRTTQNTTHSSRMNSAETIGAIGKLVALDTLPLDTQATIYNVRLERAASRLIYRLTTSTGQRTFDAHTGMEFKLKRDEATQLAQTSYQGDGVAINSEWLPHGSDEVPKAGAVWRVAFNDQLSTRVYVSALDGAIVAHRNQYWKVVDFLLMLHFMDYVRAQHFNNPQIIVIGFLALWLTFSGLLLVKRNFTRRDFTWRGLTR